MKESDLLISRRDGAYTVKVSGRANFDYAVPLRELARNLEGDFKHLYFDLHDCVTMDSTFMGVMSMIGLKAYRARAVVELAGASAQVRHLLKGLGIDRLFTFVDSAPVATHNDWEFLGRSGERDQLKTAETVVEAHETLVEADSENREKFGQVIDFAREDLARIRSEEQEKP